MEFTLGQAAKRLGVSKPTVSKFLKRGDISYRKLESGAFAIDGAELARFEASYNKPEPSPAAASVMEKAADVAGGGADRWAAAEAELLRARVAQLEAEVAEVRAELKEAHAAEREAWRSVAQIKLLEGGQRKSWLARLTGR